jgi:heptosyltransferase III
VVLTLPLAGIIKEKYPACSIYFLGRSYTKDVIALSKHITGFINYDDLEKRSTDEQIHELKKIKADIFVHVFPKKEIAQLAKKANIPLRVGTTNRFCHWMTCNKLVRLSRKNSDLHEAQLNVKLLAFLVDNFTLSLNHIPNYYGFDNLPSLLPENELLIDKTKFNIILHPKSKGSAREWGLDNFKALMELLPEQHYKIFISGTDQDSKQMQEFLRNPKMCNITGKLSLQQFIAFISKCDGMIAASTGPLHIAAALNKKAIGLYAPMRPIHPGRWAPLGKKAVFLVENKNCQRCKHGGECFCMKAITPQQVKNELDKQ